MDGGEAASFLNRLTERIAAIRIGPHTDRPEPFYGPLISGSATTKLLSAQDDLVRRGGNALVASAPQQGCSRQV